MNLNLERNWLLRIGGQVCGPFHDNEIHALILSQQVSEVDEIAKPCKAWKFVRDESCFEDTFVKIHDKSFSKNIGEVSLTGTADVTALSDMDRTEEVDLSREEKTQKLINLGHSGPLHSPKISAPLDVNKMRSSSNQIQIKEVKKSKKSFFLFLVFSALLLAGGYYYFNHENNLVKGFWASSEFEQDFQVYWSAGNYTEALAALNASGPKLIKKNQLQYIALLILNEVGQEKIDVALNDYKNKNSVVWKNLKGVSLLHKRQFSKAENYFLNVLKDDPTYTPAFINMGLIKKLESNWEEARYYFESAFANETENHYDDTAFFLAEAWGRQILEGNGSVELKEVQSFVTNTLMTYTSYAPELRFFLAWLKMMGKEDQATTLESLYPLLKLDPSILSERLRSPYVFRLSPGTFFYVCDDLQKNLGSFPNKKAYLSYCYLVDKDLSMARQVFASENLSGADLSFYGFALLFNSEERESEEILVRAMEKASEDNLMRFYLQARFCERKGDLKCAANYWKEILRFDSKSYVAQTGLARSYFNFGDRTRFQAYYDKAHDLSDSYGPLIELKERVLRAD